MRLRNRIYRAFEPFTWHPLRGNLVYGAISKLVVSRCIRQDKRHNATWITETRRGGPVRPLRMGKVVTAHTCVHTCVPVWPDCLPV